MAEAPGLDYKVVFSGRDLERLKGWARSAIAVGQGQAFLEFMRALQQKLATEPQTWGDPLYRLRNLGLVIYHRSHGIFQVLYALAEKRRIVYVKEIKLRPETALGQDLQGKDS